MKKFLVSYLRRWLRLLRHYFVTGFLLFIPAFITIWILIWVFDTLDGVLQKPIEWIFGRYYEGIGFAIIIVLILLFGIVGSRVAGRNLIKFLESLIGRIPVVRQLYNGTKQIIDSFRSTTRGSFMDVVFMEFPRKGIYTIALVTNETVDETGKKVLNLYVPTAPNPTSGYLQIVEEKDIVRSNMSVDDALKMIISAGAVSHADINYLMGHDWTGFSGQGRLPTFDGNEESLEDKP